MLLSSNLILNTNVFLCVSLVLEDLVEGSEDEHDCCLLGGGGGGAPQLGGGASLPAVGGLGGAGGGAGLPAVSAGLLGGGAASLLRPRHRDHFIISSGMFPTVLYCSWSGAKTGFKTSA